MKEVILISIIIVHIILSTIGTIKIQKTQQLDFKKKRINQILIWSVPFLWFVLIISILRKTPGSDEMKIKNDVSSNGFHESGISSMYTNNDN